MVRPNTGKEQEESEAKGGGRDLGLVTALRICCCHGNPAFNYLNLSNKEKTRHLKGTVHSQNKK